MAVSIADITGSSVQGIGVTSLTTGAFTVTSNANRAGLIDLHRTVNDITGLIASLGGVSASAITGADTGTSLSYRTLQMQVIAPPTGSQTATASWTTSCNAILGAKVTSGVDQSTPFNNGTFSSGNSTTPSLGITSTNGDLTASAECDGGTDSGNTTNQTLDYNQAIATGSTVTGCGDHGPGSGTTTHTWTLTGGRPWLISGANFKQAALTGVQLGTAIYVMP